MPDHEPSLPPRPAPPRSFGDTVAGWAARWLAWFGLARLALAAVSVAVVVVGGAWLLRAPQPDAAAALPPTGGTVQPGTARFGASTLPPPTTLPPVSTVPAQLIVHVAGRVHAPGVYTLSAGARVANAIELAGGAAADGDLDGLNLAAPLADGQRVYVPAVGEVDPAAVPGGAAPPGPVDAAAGAAGPVDLNSASAEQLDELPGVGPATAAAIIDDRDRNGPFATVDDLDRVPGIGPAKLDALRGLVTV